MSSLKGLVFRGMIWNFFEQIGSHLIVLSVQLVLARILGPEEFGTVALLSIFLSISRVLVISGFQTALIQKKDVDARDFDSVFLLSLFTAAVMYSILWFAAPAISRFFARPVLISILRILSLQLFLTSFESVQNAMISRSLNMKLSFWTSLPSLFVSGIVGIVLAVAGLGVWALVWSNITGSVARMAIRSLLVDWRPHFRFSFSRIAALFSFGSRMLASSLLDAFFGQLSGLLIGKWFSPSELAFYHRGQHMPNVVLSGIQGSVGRVVFPTLSRLQDDISAMKKAMRKLLQMTTFLSFPFLLGMAVVSKPLVQLLLTDKWLPSVPVMQVACVAFAFRPVYTINSQVMQALGRSDLYLKLEVLKKGASLSLLLISFRFGILAISVGSLLASLFSMFVNTWPNKHLIRYSFSDQILDIAKPLLLSVGMVCATYPFSFTGWRPFPMLLVQTIVGIFVYLSLARLFRVSALADLADLFPMFSRIPLFRINKDEK